jgi:predicted ATPase
LDTLFIIFTGIYFASSDAMLKRIKIMFSIEEIKKSFSSDIQLDPVEWTVHDKKFKSLRDRVLAIKLIGLIEKLDSYIYIADLNIRYIAPIRATAERYYRVQNLALGEVDPQGQNVPMILKNMEESERKNFEIWTKDHFGFILRAVSSGGHISLNMKDISDSEEFNLADTGFGYSQILPILLQLWLLLTKKSGPLPVIFAIEQPELHLHPGLQAKLADVFIASIKLARENEIDLRLIIETHSEIIVNRMGHRIANEDLSPEDVNVVLFEKEPSALSTKVSFSGYDEDGFLTNWPIGFLEPDII